MLLLFAVVKAISEVLILAFLIQSVVRLISKTYESNIVYRICATVTRPVTRVARLIMPRFVLDRHIWMVAVLIVIVLWAIAGQQKRKLCVTEISYSVLCVELTKR